jgi:hypothetical protein
MPSVCLANPRASRLSPSSRSLLASARIPLFSVVSGVLLNSLPYPHPNQVVTVATWMQDSEGGPSYPDFLDWARDNQTFSSPAAYQEDSFNLIGQADAQRVNAMRVSASFSPRSA